MLKQSTGATLLIATILFIASTASASALSQTIICTDDYTVQAGDWLSTIAEKYYGDVLAYTVIVNATNAAALENEKYTFITDPGLIEPAQTLCIPAGPDAEAMLNGKMPTPEPIPAILEDKMLIIAGNRTLANIPSTLTLSGGQFEGGQEFTIDAGHEIRLELEPGDYRASWSAPGQATFSRSFKARAAVVAIIWIVPEEDYVYSEIQRTGLESEDTRTAEALGQLARPSVTTMETPYQAPEGQALLVAGNRSFAGLPSTLTISGGLFGGGREFTISPGQELQIALDPTEYSLTWSAPAAEGRQPFSRGGTVQPTAGQISIIWIVPEEGRAFLQRPGEPGQAFE